MTLPDDLRRVVSLIAEYEANPRDADGCSMHPEAPHGFDRNGSHSADRYVCECEGWEPDIFQNAQIAGYCTDFIRQHKAELLGLVERVKVLEKEAAWKLDNWTRAIEAERLRKVAAEQRAERAERDARRYAWLQGAPHQPCRLPCAYAVVNDKLEPIGREQLDAAIDTALAARGEVGK